MKQALRILLPGCTVILVLVIAVYRFQQPFWNWDMLPYMAGAVEMDGAGPAECHQRAYEAAELHVPGPVYDQLIDSGSDYRKAMYADHEAFADQMPLYWVKPFYIATVLVAWKCGASLPRATLWPSFIGFLLVGLALFILLRRALAMEVAAIVTVLFAALPCVNELAGLSTPDALGAAMMMFAIVRFTRTSQAIWGLLFLVLAVAARADNGILAALLLIAQPWYAQHTKLHMKVVAAGMVLLIATYLAVDHLACSHGWCVRPSTSFLPHSLHPGDERLELSMDDYVAAMRKGFDSLRYTWVVEFAVVGVISFLFAVSARPRSLSGVHRLLVVITTAMVIRYMLFPIPDDRALIPWYATITIASATGVARLARTQRTTAP